MAKLTEKSQAWFFTPEWQAGEREADEDLDLGRIRILTPDEFKREIKDQIQNDR